MGFGFLLSIGGTTQTVVANGDTRTLSMLHKHTGEQILITFKRNGRYDQEALRKLNWFLRDWRRDEPTRMDPALFDIVWEVYRAVGAQSPIHVVSAYRSAGTNAMLRRRSRGVAQHSRHITGQAMDFYIPGASMTRVREAGLRLQRGGVGFYPGSANQFVHMDTGSVRHWPKVSRDYLARLFPDGRTVHIPADGRPMPGFDAALAMVRSRGGSASRFYDSRQDESEAYDDGGDRTAVVRQRSNSMGLFAGLFGGGQQAQPERPAAPARRAPRGPAAPQPAEAAPGVPAAPATPAAPVTAVAAARPAAEPAAGAPVQITGNRRVIMALAPLPLRPPGLAERQREAERLIAAPLPPARPQQPGEAPAAEPETTFASLAPPAAAGSAVNRPMPLPEPHEAAGAITLASAPLPVERPQAIGGSTLAAALPPLITTGDQRGRAAPAETPPAFALAFASPSQPVTLPSQAATRQPRVSAPAVRSPAAASGAAPSAAREPAAPVRPARAAAPAPALVAPSPAGARGHVVFVRQPAARSAAVAGLTAPDPRQAALIGQPVQMIAMTFSRAAPATVPTQRFTGPAVAALRTLDFDQPASEQRAALAPR